MHSFPQKLNCIYKGNHIPVHSFQKKEIAHRNNHIAAHSFPKTLPNSNSSYQNLPSQHKNGGTNKKNKEKRKSKKARPGDREI